MSVYFPIGSFIFRTLKEQADLLYSSSEASGDGLLRRSYSHLRIVRVLVFLVIFPARSEVCDGKRLIGDISISGPISFSSFPHDALTDIIYF